MQATDEQQHSNDLSANDPDGAPGCGPREIGRAGDPALGNSLVCVAGQHGNEPSGVEACARVLRDIEKHSVPLAGEFVALRGNVSALAEGVRYRVADLNRLWTPERVQRVRRKETIHEGGHEFEEMDDLHRAITTALARATGECALLDMHTTSAPSAPFVVMEDRLPNRPHASRFGTPVVLGLEEVLLGTLPDAINDLGHVSLGFEAGQHDDPKSVDRHESAVWTMLVSLRIVRAGDVPGGMSVHRERLASAARGLPRFLELRHLHTVRDGDAFAMKPGLTNFGRINKGDRLANDRSGPINAPQRGRVFMPLYQPLGEDGFFIVRRVGPVWLTLSSMLRKLGAERLAPLLPGVRRDPAHPGVLIADRAVARWFTVEIFHLLGFRRRTDSGDEIVFSRRHDDLDRANASIGHRGEQRGTMQTGD